VDHGEFTISDIYGLKRKRSLMYLFFVLLTVHLEYNRVKKETNLMHNLLLVYFINLFMFRAYLSPSSGGTTI